VTFRFALVGFFVFLQGRGSNPRPYALKASAQPLSYTLSGSTAFIEVVGRIIIEDVYSANDIFMTYD
jgi:hypothetical protein